MSDMRRVPRRHSLERAIYDAMHESHCGANCPCGVGCETFRRLLGSEAHVAARAALAWMKANP